MAGVKAVDEPVGYGLIGAGAFGRFCIEQYRTLPGVRCVAVADVNAAAAASAAQTLGVPGLEACASVEALLAREDVELVHLATPPSTHAPLAMQAMQAGKHVLCEKPLALTLEDAQAMTACAAKHRRVLAVNLIMRYNPLIDAVNAVLATGLLGTVLRGSFENLAKDQDLPPGHWFWDAAKSGGIFIEHGVHFFDLFDDVLQAQGQAQVLSAHQTARPGTHDLIDQVEATVRYGSAADGPVGHFYHGFTQANAMDRQRMKFVGTRGDITLHEWVPTRMEVDVLCTRDAAQQLAERIPNAQLESLPVEASELANPPRARGETFAADGRYRLTGHVGMAKPVLYGHVLRALLADQIAAIRNPDHVRRVTEANGLQSVALAVQATQRAAAGA